MKIGHGWTRNGLPFVGGMRESVEIYVEKKWLGMRYVLSFICKMREGIEISVEKRDVVSFVCKIKKVLVVCWKAVCALFSRRDAVQLAHN